MLKQIVFRGFKSFADEQIVNFEKGVTGIIGPNGCGKSNIIDGISFVLGSQSAKNLRGGKMQDLIFSGSDKRKPMDEAEVTLVLDNESGIFKKSPNLTVSITRRVFRAGGSEYFIDGEPARLKDVHELFMDTGVGSDSYSIIGQGQIGKILSTKLEERRAIFEEASGIVKLKQQKEQTEKRLGEVDTNLIRVEDIVKEIEKQLKPLKRQSEKALQFQELDGELKTLEVQYLVHEFDRSNEKIVTTTEEIHVLQEKMNELITKMDEKEQAITNAKESYQKENTQLFDLQNQASECKEEVEKINGSIQLNDERIENAKKQIQEVEESLQEIEEKHSLSTEDFKNKKARLEAIAVSLKEKETALHELNEKISSLENEKMVVSNDIDHTRKQSIDEYNELNQKKYELEQLENKIKDAETEIETVIESAKDIIEEAKTLEEEYTKEEQAYQHASQTYQQTLSTFNEKKETLKRLQSDYASNLTNMQQTESQWIRLKSKVESIETFIENNEGFFEGVKAILNAKKEGEFDGVYGAVAEVIQTDKKYEVAIEGLLQSSMQYLITKDDSVAKACIQFLKQGQKGKATFLPLNLANPHSFDQRESNEIANYPGVRPALDGITYDATFEPVMRSLLGRSIVADNLDVGLNFLKQKKIRAKISTIDGEIIQSGSISGGQSKKQKTNFFAKRRELDELKEQFDQTNASLQDMKQKDESLKTSISSLESEVDTLSTQVEDEKITTDEQEKAMNYAKQQFEKVDEKKQSLAVQEEELKVNVKEMKRTAIKLKFSVDTMDTNYYDMNENLTSLEQRSKNCEIELNDTKEQKTSVVLDVNRLTDEQTQIQSYLDEFANDNDSLEEKIQKLYTRKEEENKRIIELVEHGEGLAKQYNGLKAKLDEQNQSIESLYAENKELLEETEQLEKELKETRSEKESVDKELNQKEVFLSRKETERLNTLNKLFETYEVVEENIAEIERREIDFAESKKRINELKKQIGSLGNINHTAVEEYQKLEERYSTEKEQLDDVKTAKGDLTQLLKTVEEEMIQRFTTSFNTIAEKFETCFTELFEGGKAKLTLENPKDPLSSAIEIVAQPPGKKPATINSLSGGEKAFTAVALIFAIIISKPSPFIILDEVDAPLDDANVARFAYYLSKYKDLSQFVVITHRRGTMHICDTILGLSQIERGISIIFPHALDTTSIEELEEQIQEEDKKTS